MTQSAGYFQYYDATGRAGKLLGMDISTAGAQYPVNWATSYAYGVRYVYMKTGNGTTSDDANFLTANIASARSAGLKVGTYHFSAPEVTGWSVSASESEANKYCDRLIAQFPAGDTGDLMPCLDMESGTALVGVTTDEIRNWIIGFINQVKLRIGRHCILYTNYYSIDVTFPDPIISNLGTVCPLWLAGKAPDLVYNQPPTTYPNYNFTAFGDFPGDLWDLWQYSSDGNGQGSLFGVASTDIDTDILEGDFYSLQRPSQITGVTTTPANNSLLIQWTTPPDTDILQYNIYIDGFNVGNSPSSPYTKTGLINNLSYDVQVTAVDQWEESILSVVIIGTPNGSTVYTPLSKNLYVFDLDEKLTNIIEISKLISAHQLEKTTKESNFEVELADNLDASINCIAGNYFGFYDLDNDFVMFEILVVEDIETSAGINKKCMCENVYYELRDNIIEDLRAEQATAITAVSQALTNSRWSVGNVDTFGIHTQNFWYETSLSCIDKVRQRWTYLDVNGKPQQGVFKFRLTLTGNVITGREVDFLRQTGAYTGKRAVIGKDILTIKRTVDNKNLITGAYGQGKGEEVETDNKVVIVDMEQEGDKTYNKRVTFANAFWTQYFPQITNTGFETGLSPNWTLIVGGGTTTIDTTRYYRGTQSVKMVDTAVLYPCTIVSDAIYPVTVGWSITTTLWVNSPTLLTDGTHKGINVNVFYYIGAIYQGFFNTLQFNPLVANRWEMMTLLTVIPAGIDGVKFSIETNANINEPGDVYFDEFKTSFPAYKAYGLTYVSDPVALATYGRAGGTLDRWGFYYDEEEQNPWVLLQKTWDYIQENNTPNISYEADILDLESLLNYSHEKMRLGDLIYLLDENFRVPVEITARIIDMDRDLLLAENTKVGLGNFLEDSADINQRQADIEKKITARADVWNRAGAFETAVEGTRMRMITKEGEFQSQLKYEDNAIPPNLIGYFSPEEFNYKRVRSDEFIGQNIINVTREPLNYWIDSYAGDDFNTGTQAFPYKTISRLLSNGTIPKVLLNDVNVRLLDSNPGGAGSSPFNEDVIFTGIVGSGIFNINFNKDVILNGSLFFNGCTAWCFVQGAKPSTIDYGYILTTDTNIPIRTNNCNYVICRYMWLSGNSSALYCALGVASHLTVIESVTEYSTLGAITASNGASVYVDTCVGSNNGQYGIYSRQASFIGAFGSIPTGGIVDYLAVQGGLIVPSAQTGQTPIAGVASPVAITQPAQQTTASSVCSLTSSWRYNYKYYRTDNQLVYQGSWGFGNHIGLMYFNGAVTFSNIQASATAIKSAILYVRRTNVAGYSIAKGIRIWGHDRITQPQIWLNSYLKRDYGVLASLKWGEEIGISMPSQFLLDVGSGLVKGLAIYEASETPYVTLYGKNQYVIQVEFKYF